MAAKIRMLVAAFAVGVVLSAAAAEAAPISTTSCEAIADRKMSKDGKNYTCTGCQECKTTTCEGEGGINCSIATTTSCGDCTEVASEGVARRNHPRCPAKRARSGTEAEEETEASAAGQRRDQAIRQGG